MPNTDPSRRFDPQPSRPVTIPIVMGPMLCDLRVWSDADWEALPDRERPAVRERVHGLGWLGAVPVQCLN